MNNSGVKLNELRYYLSTPFAMTIAVQTDTPRKMEVNGGTLVISGGQDISTREKEFAITDAGALRNIGASSETLVVVFKDTPLTFRKNLQGRYDLSSYEIEAGTYNFRYEDGLPQLCILAELKERHEVLAFADSTPGSYTGNVQQQTYNININSSSNVPSRQIMDRGSVTFEGAAAYLRSLNRSFDSTKLRNLISTYIREAEIEGVNHDIAIAQMLYATNFLSNQRMTTHNYGGLSTNGLRWNGTFPNRLNPDRLSDGMTEGVRAHIQHLKGYASRASLNRPLVDPRYQILKDVGYWGRAGTFDDLYGYWAENSGYGNNIERILRGLWSSAM
jgi:hypothetical protein